MRKLFYFTTLLLATAALLFNGCADNCERTYTQLSYEPVYMSYADMRSPSAVEVQAPTALKDPGKIHIKDGYLYVNERGKGFHVIDNRNPAAPVKVAFVKIPGNYEIAVRGNMLYADSYVDMLVFDVSDVAHPNMTNRMQDILPYEQYVNNVWLDPSKGVVKEWVEKIETVTISCSDWNVLIDSQPELLNSTTGGSVSSGSGKSSGSDVTNGISGSMARFVLQDNYLYTGSNNILTAFDLTNLSQPVQRSQTNIPVTIETLFAYGSNLYIGSSTGMYIYSISDLATPQYMSVYSHITACDPVVVKGDYAYVTLRTGNFCTGWENLLEVVNISNPATPYQVASYNMTNPHGLGISGNTLFVCDGTAGLKVFDASNVNTITSNLLRQYTSMQATDVIPFANQYLLMVGSDGLAQFDFSDVQNIKQISTIPVEE